MKPAPLQIGNANEIYEQPNCKFVADFIEVTFLTGKVQRQQGTIATVALPGGLTVQAESEQTLAVGKSLCGGAPGKDALAGPGRV